MGTLNQRGHATKKGRIRRGNQVCWTRIFSFFFVFVVWKWNASAALNTSSKSVLGQRERTQRPRPFIRHPSWSPDASRGTAAGQSTQIHRKRERKRERWNWIEWTPLKIEWSRRFHQMMLRLKRKQEGIIGPRGYLRNILSFLLLLLFAFLVLLHIFFTFLGSSLSTFLVVRLS